MASNDPVSNAAKAKAGFLSALLRPCLVKKDMTDSYCARRRLSIAVSVKFWRVELGQVSADQTIMFS